MRQNSASLMLSLLLLGLALSALPSPSADNEVGEQLKTAYRGRVLTFRHFYDGEHLRFGVDHRLVTEARIGPWTVDGQVEVRSVSLRGRVLRIEGRRLWLFFDPTAHQFRDIFSIGRTEKVASLFNTIQKQDLWKQLAKNQHVEIDVELASENPDVKDVSFAIDAIFLAQTESLADVVPSFWRSYFAGQKGRTDDEPGFDEAVYRVKQGEVSAPHPLNTPNPEYSEPARQAGYLGRVGMSLVVDKTGNPRDIQIVKPAGLGLDEKSVEAVSSWKFAPGEKDARAVAVKLEVNTSFRFY